MVREGRRVCVCVGVCLKEKESHNGKGIKQKKKAQGKCRQKIGETEIAREE